MADNHVRASQAADHGPGHFACVCALLGPEQVLRADPDARALRRGDGRRKVREGRADGDLAMLGALYQWAEFLKEDGGLCGGLEHLPIARHHRFSHTIAGKKLVPFSR